MLGGFPPNIAAGGCAPSPAGVDAGSRKSGGSTIQRAKRRAYSLWQGGGSRRATGASERTCTDPLRYLHVYRCEEAQPARSDRSPQPRQKPVCPWLLDTRKTIMCRQWGIDQVTEKGGRRLWD